ncbi:MAG: Gx transporter family protein [Clostridiales bacterium]|nr:Gx transporter family protein [Clostridiales bacterium]
MAKRTAFLGMATALAMIVSYVETLIPFHPGIPGAKIGLTNIVILIVLYQNGFRDAAAVSGVRIVLTGFLFGNLSAIFYSLAGGAVSLCVMQMMKEGFPHKDDKKERKEKKFSILGVSTAGGVAHNLGQLCVAVLIVENASLLYYLPFLIVSGLVAGICIGIAAKGVLVHLNAG